MQMSDPSEHDNVEYLVVVNDERQYSIWPSYRELPAGWNAAGTRGSRAECLAWIEANWTDMRPRSLAEAMDGRPE
jgi:MbtH protein